MSIQEFKNNVKFFSDLNEINFSDEEIEKLYVYKKLLLEWNEKINLTSITQENDIILKHFMDCAIVSKYIDNDKNLIDVGTGAGFPGIVLKILNEDLNITLLDALNKRITFLDEVISEIDLNNIETVHGRAEEFGRNIKYRESFDIVVSRAVANMNVLLEYMMPFVKVGGKCICMKASSSDDELENSKNVISLLGGEIEKNDKIYLKNKENEILERSIIVIKKKFPISDLYPRTFNKINKKPLI